MDTDPTPSSSRGPFTASARRGDRPRRASSPGSTSASLGLAPRSLRSPVAPTRPRTERRPSDPRADRRPSTPSAGLPAHDRRRRGHRGRHRGPARAHRQPLARRTPRSSSRSERATGSSVAPTSTTTPPRPPALPDVATFTSVDHGAGRGPRPRPRARGGNDFTPPDDIARMRELGIPVIVVYAETVDEVLADIDLIGEAIGGGRRRPRPDADMAPASTRSRRGRRHRATPRVFYELGSEPEIYGPAPDSFIADMIVLAGGEPVTTGDPRVLDPGRGARRGRPGGHRRGRRRSTASARAGRRGPGWDGHHGGGRGSRPAGRRHPRHPARTAARRGPGLAGPGHPPRHRARPAPPRSAPRAPPSESSQPGT